MTKSVNYRDEKWLRKQYRDRKRSSIDIAEECGVSPSTVCRWLNRHGIKVRSDKEQAEQYSESDDFRFSVSVTKTSGRSKPLQDESWLREKYIDEDLSSYEIADRCGVSRPTVTNWLHRHGIEVADPGPQNPGDIDQLDDAEWLHEQYVEKDRPITKIAEIVDTDHKTVRRYMDNYGIDREFSGEHSHLWKGGYEDYYGPSWYRQRRKALQRDQARCQECGVTEAKHVRQNGRGLHVHHIDPFRTFDDSRKANELENLICLCTSCHARVEAQIQVRETEESIT